MSVLSALVSGDRTRRAEDAQGYNLITQNLRAEHLANVGRQFFNRFSQEPVTAEGLKDFAAQNRLDPSEMQYFLGLAKNFTKMHRDKVRFDREGMKFNLDKRAADQLFNIRQSQERRSAELFPVKKQATQAQIAASEAATQHSLGAEKRAAEQESLTLANLKNQQKVDEARIRTLKLQADLARRNGLETLVDPNTGKTVTVPLGGTVPPGYMKIADYVKLHPPVNASTLVALEKIRQGQKANDAKIFIEANKEADNRGLSYGTPERRKFISDFQAMAKGKKQIAPPVKSDAELSKVIESPIAWNNNKPLYQLSEQAIKDVTDKMKANPDIGPENAKRVYDLAMAKRSAWLKQSREVPPVTSEEVRGPARSLADIAARTNTTGFALPFGDNTTPPGTRGLTQKQRRSYRYAPTHPFKVF